MQGVLINPYNKKVLSSLHKDPPHATIITAKKGLVGDSLSDFLKTKDQDVISIFPTKDNERDDQNGIISAKEVRDLVRFLATKLAKKRFIVIYAAEKMTTQAAAAFLKILEEPTDKLHFVLVSVEPGKILPTICSRCQLFHLRLLSTQQSLVFLEQFDLDKERAAQILFLADGRPMLLESLSQDTELFAQKASRMRDAKILTSGNAFEKISLANTYRDQRADAIELVDFSIKICEQLFRKTHDQSVMKKIIKLIALHETLLANGNIRLQIANFVL